MDTIAQIRSKLEDAKGILRKLQELKQQEEQELNKWQEELENSEKRINSISEQLENSEA
jgi:Skp family chaperone for outer membrane proteins